MWQGNQLSVKSPLIFELSEGSETTYQTLKLGASDSPKIQETPRRKRKLFWWLRGGWGKPQKFDELETLQQKPVWIREWYKPLQMLTYPQGPGSCDHNSADRTINLLTTLPFFGVAYHTYKARKTQEGRRWGLSLVGVGLGSIAFHTTSGDARPWGRKVDYWAIALSSISLTRCLYPNARKGLTALALGVATVNPLAVSTVNAAAMEAKFIERAHANPELRKHHKAHLGTVLLGTASFIAEEFYPHAPVIHAGWHIWSALSVASTNYLLADLEARRRPRRASLSDESRRASQSSQPPASGPPLGSDATANLHPKYQGPGQ